jgi:methyltransferase (TIGR00027 family)
METGRASKTALRVAIRRAAHQLADQPAVLHDPIVLPLLGSGFARDMERAMHKVARDFRAFLAARSRYVEDRLADAVTSGVTQYVVLGAGLDTFAYRNSFSSLHVFEVDFPATQEGKRAMLEKAGIPLPRNLTFVPTDFEHQALGDALGEAAFDAQRPAFFGWMGVVPYLTLEAFRATLHMAAELPAGTAISFDYIYPPASLSPQRRKVFNGLADRVAAAGEPFQLFFTPEQMEIELHIAGFHRVVQVGTEELNELYFNGRSDGLRLSLSDMGKLVTAWV